MPINQHPSTLLVNSYQAGWLQALLVSISSVSLSGYGGYPPEQNRTVRMQRTLPSATATTPRSAPPWRTKYPSPTSLQLPTAYPPSILVGFCRHSWSSSGSSTSTPSAPAPIATIFASMTPKPSRNLRRCSRKPPTESTTCMRVSMVATRVRCLLRYRRSSNSVSFLKDTTQQKK